MKLVDDARRWWRWHTTYVFAAIIAFPEIWLHSTDLQALLPPAVVSHIAPIVGVIGFLLRIRKQTPVPPTVLPPDDDNAEHA